jgi:hypothetical protein
MNVAQYSKRCIEMGFTEYPMMVTPGVTPRMMDVVNLEEAELDLKRHVAGVLLCRCFPFTGGVNFGEPEWFITHFLTMYKEDAVRPWLTKTIQRAIELINSDNVFTDNLIGTTFMFGILEFYVKQKLSGRPLPVHSFEQNDNNGKYLSLEYALDELQKKELPISIAVNKIDDDMYKVLSRWEKPEDDWKRHKVVSRVSKARNDMLHGNKHTYYSMGEYMAMLYILFHLYDLNTEPPQIHI